MRDGRIQVGEALREFRGVLTGVPVYEGPTEPVAGNRAKQMNASARDLRILIMAPTAQGRRHHDASCSTAPASRPRRSPDLDALVDALDDGAAAVLVAEEHLPAAHKAPLAAMAGASSRHGRICRS